MKKRILPSALYTLIIILGDLIAFYLSLFFAYQLRLFLIDFELFNLFIKFIYVDYVYVYFPFTHLLTLWWMPLIIIFLFFYEQLYLSRYPFWEEARNIIKVLSISVLVIIAFIFVGKITSRTSALAIVFFYICSIFMFPIFRLWVKKFINRSKLGKENILILGAGKSGVETAQGILKEKHMGYNLIGFLDDDETKQNAKLVINELQYTVLDRIENFKKYIDLYYPLTIIIAMPSSSQNKISEISNEVQKYVKRLFVVPELKGVSLLNTQLFHLFNEERFLLKIVNNFQSLITRITKRLFEILLSILILPFVLPLIALLGLLIRIDSKGSAFFLQERLGKKNKNFKCVKFRTMHLNNDEILENYLNENDEVAKEWKNFKKLKGFDPRVTRMGGFLRKTSLDELPQIFNVLKGEMSLIGPRPYLPKEKNDIGKYLDIILYTKPGITGLWQVSGRNELEFEKRLKLDSWYIINWSIWLDIVILFKTVRVVLKREGAY